VLIRRQRNTRLGGPLSRLKPAVTSASVSSVRCWAASSPGGGRPSRAAQTAERRQSAAPLSRSPASRRSERRQGARPVSGGPLSDERRGCAATPAPASRAPPATIQTKGRSSSHIRLFECVPVAHASRALGKADERRSTMFIALAIQLCLTGTSAFSRAAWSSAAKSLLAASILAS
jgi:hypothetical protein